MVLHTLTQLGSTLSNFPQFVLLAITYHGMAHLNSPW